MTLPVKGRAAFASGCTVTKARDGCLWLYEPAEWEQVRADFAKLSTGDRRVRDALRFFFGSAETQVPDAQGRIRIPGALREHARLTNEVVFVPLANRIEIWDERTWTEMQASLGRSVDELSDAGDLPI